MAKFQKGKSGNPGGRPKVLADVQEAAREHTAQAIETLVSIMQNAKAPPAARVSAANAILDRGYGKPKMSASIDTPNDHRDLTEWTTDELIAFLNESAKDTEIGRQRRERQNTLAAPAVIP